MTEKKTGSGADAGGATMKDAFSGYHPAVNFLYFTLVILFSMFFMHPACLAISLTCSFIYSISLNGKKARRFNFLFLVPMMLVAALLNPAFNHEGVTILLYLKSGNPLTLESIAYGAAAAAMLAAVICWFSCYNAVMTSDKFVYLFGRVIPALSLILSMVLRFVPRFRAQIRQIAKAQKSIGRDASSGGILTRARRGVTIFSILVTWALENAVETADSMRGRGYGLPGRSAFSIYRLEGRDLRALFFMGAMGAYVVAGNWAGGLYWRYFPGLRGVSATFFSCSLFAAYFILCMTPFVIDRIEDRKWKALQSKI
ncbi:MAG: energy-coupling factor transporter transmembrane protein EcfT [Clostridiales Family XIII bacterium]|jgi:energy-coupling factor transport system permease protein|nr:energy-coupling factor transporter transmembrane protein EcfT [Clostridiales Family XIII bacterium]